ncbi:FACT complex subunit SSRP1 [Orchesella cincta]|uniref:FACT complex subunit SSRP1 n=1 Tax=Orchesella cincta TaxID=48709 RepID=A0A1D2MYP6_ORCCI|nr:FACT complex subunit SSRP1 [Orchesella cincta]
MLMAKALDGGIEFQDALLEQRGAMQKGRLKFMDSGIVFKNSKTGKVENIGSTDIDVVTWQRFAGHWGIRIFAKNGTLHRLGGFREADKEKIAKVFTTKYNNSMLDKELCLKGWNWGTAKFQGSVLSFEVAKDLDFEVPLNYVSQCTTGKNEVTLEFHQNDDAPVSLMELRFHIPSSELAGDDPVENFKDQVMGKASIISAVGDAIAIFREIQCLTPRGRYDIKMFQTFFQLHGKTFDYKIPMSTVLRLFLLPHKDGRQMFFVVSLDPPIKQGQTRYHYLTFLFGQDEEDVSIELPLSEEELKKKYDGKLEKELSGPVYDVIGKIMKTLVSRKITVPGSFKGHSGTPAITCSYKAAAGYMYPLDRGFIYVHKPPLHIRFEELNSVNFARSGGSTRSFDFEVETKSGVVHTFSSIEKEEYPKLFDFISEKKLRVKNRGKLDNQPYTGDFDNSDEEVEPDAYLARVKAEAQERSDDESLEEESEDEDYNPDKDVKKAAAEDSAAGSSGSGSSDGDEGTDPDEIGSDMDTSPKKKKERKPKKDKKEEGGEKRKKKKKGDKDPNAPKRPMSGYFIWLNSNRESLKKKFPGLSLTEFTKKAGEEWKKMEDKTKWEAKAKEAKEDYEEQMKEYKKNGGGAKPSTSSSSGKSKPSKTKTPAKKAETSTTTGSGKGYLSKEFISDDSSSSDGEGGSKKKKGKKESSGSKAKGPAKGKGKANSKKKESESEPEASGSGSGSESGSAIRQLRFSPVLSSCRCVFRSMSSAMNFKVEHDPDNKKFFIKLGDAEAKLEYVKNDLNGNTVLDMWHTEVPPPLQGKGIAKILAQEAFDYVVENKLKMQLTCSYLQKYLKDNPLDKYKSAVA